MYSTYYFSTLLPDNSIKLKSNFPLDCAEVLLCVQSCVELFRDF